MEFRISRHELIPDLQYETYVSKRRLYILFLNSFEQKLTPSAFRAVNDIVQVFLPDAKYIDRIDEFANGNMRQALKCHVLLSKEIEHMFLSHCLVLTNATIELLRYTLAVSSSIKDGEGLRTLDVFTFKTFKLNAKKLSLTDEERIRGNGLIEHAAILLSSVQLEKLTNLLNNFETFTDKNLISIKVFNDEIRNAYGHDPFSPRWRVSKDISWLNCKLTKAKHSNSRVEYEDFGGIPGIWMMVEAVQKYINEKLGVLNYKRTVEPMKE